MPRRSLVREKARSSFVPRAGTNGERGAVYRSGGAGVAGLAYAIDSKSIALLWACGFESPLRHRQTTSDAARCGVIGRPNSAAIWPSCVLAPLGQTPSG